MFLFCSKLLVADWRQNDVCDTAEKSTEIDDDRNWNTKKVMPIWYSMQWKELPQLFDQADSYSMKLIMFLHCADIHSIKKKFALKQKQNTSIEMLNQLDHLSIFRIVMTNTFKWNHANLIVTLTGKSITFKLYFCCVEKTFARVELSFESHLNIIRI